MYSFDEIQYPYIVTKQGHVFAAVEDYATDIDAEWFIDSYMKSDMRRFLDHANPKYSNMPAPELVTWFFINEPTMKDREYKKGELWDSFFMQWIGQMYAHYQWMYNIPSRELVTLLPPKEMARVYYPLHEISWDNAAEKIHTEVLRH